MIEYEEDWIFRLAFRKECNLCLRALVFAIPSTVFAVLLRLGHLHLDDIVDTLGLPTITDDDLVKRPATWLALTGTIVALLDFRTQQALSRFWEGTSLLHQMRGEWFDSISCLVTFAMLAVDTKPKEVRLFRHTIVRLMSLCHGSALEEIADSDSGIAYLDCVGIDETTRLHLALCKEKYGFNRVEMVLKVIYTLMTNALGDEVLKIPPPILTRVYQTLSRGFVCILNAKKITDTRFPFPYAQLIAGLLFIMQFMIPVVMAMLVRSAVFAGIFTFVPVFGLFFVNFIASELENPFGHDDNDLPLARFQEEMNSSLLMLLHGRADHVATINETAITDCHTLARVMGLWRGVNPKLLSKPKHSTSRMSSFENCEYPLEDEPQEPPEEFQVALAVEKKSSREAPPPDVSAEELHIRALAKSMLDFNRTLQRWTRTVEGQATAIARLLKQVTPNGEALQQPVPVSSGQGAG